MYKFGHIENRIRSKKHYAEKYMNLPEYSKVPINEREIWQKKYNILNIIKEQIEICEQLARPLSTEMIEELCNMRSEIQIYNYCSHVKFA